MNAHDANQIAFKNGIGVESLDNSPIDYKPIVYIIK